VARAQRLTVPHSGPIEALIASAQGGLDAAEKHTDYRGKKALHRAARIQAECAIALAIRELADAVRALVVVTEENT
jgi:hypothetical protein